MYHLIKYYDYLLLAATFKIDDVLVAKLVSRFGKLVSPSIIPEIVAQLENDGIIKQIRLSRQNLLLKLILTVAEVNCVMALKDLSEGEESITFALFVFFYILFYNFFLNIPHSFFLPDFI
jgi:hypothetical protein